MSSTEDIKLKKCNVCKKDLDKSMFHKNRIMKDGLQRTCKNCSKTYGRKKKKVIKKAFVEDINNLPQFDIRKELTQKNDIFFSATFIAQSRSGKTTLLKYLLRKIKDMYDIIIVITQSGHNIIYDDDVFDITTTGADGQYKKIIKLIRLFQTKTKNKVKWLVIFDDFSKPRCPLMRDLYTNGRNSSISVIHLVQDVCMSMNQCRFNSLFIFLFHQKNPQLVKRTVEHFLLDFVPVPDDVRTKFDKMTFLINWMQTQSQNYNSIVLNVDQGKIMKVRAN
jgi:hypothetical protein